MVGPAHRPTFQQPTNPPGKLPSLVMVALLLTGAILGGCGRKTPGKFVETSHIESELRRGISTKDDVRQVLGEPNGAGAALLPTQTGGVREIWYYENIQTLDTERVGGAVRLDMNYQQLMVFFKEEKFDGFMWWRQDERGTSK